MITHSQFRSRREQQTRHRTHMHHVAWGIVCVILIVSLVGIVIRTQSLEIQNASLKQQLLALKSAPTDTCRVANNWQPNTTTVMSTFGRSYRVHTPPDFDRSTYYPLLLSYSGKGGTAATVEQVFNMDNLPAIIAYPDPTPSTDGSLAWEGAPYSSRADDIAFTSAIIDQLQSQLCVNKNRIYATGLSNGGGFASFLSCKLSDKFAAYAVVSGAMYAPAGDCVPTRPTPLLNIHGDSDPVVPYSGSLTRHLPDIDAWSARRAHFNGCQAPFTDNTTLGRVTTTWSGCKNGATVKSIRIVGGGHAWGLIPNTELWQFLSRFTL